MLTLFVLILFSNVFIGTQSQETENLNKPVTVTLKGQGTIVGNTDLTLWTKQAFMQFRGIPFAESPRGERRFQPPKPRSPWTGTLDATKLALRCPVITTIEKYPPAELKKDLEDCLNLCVYTKTLNPQAALPVMFYVYGGGFYNGSNHDHPPKHLLEKDIVLVVINYRIGALGWLADYTTAIPGNAAILDILLALQWVKQHIANFGGDPSKVTLFGQSAGAASSGSLLLSPLTPADGSLFKRIILQSGSIFCNWAVNKNPLQQVERICNALKCSNCNNVIGRQTCLKNAEVLKLLKATEQESFAPVIGDLGGVLPRAPRVLAKEYKKNIPLMTGYTKDDGTFVLATQYDQFKAVHGSFNNVTVREFTQNFIDGNDDSSGLINNLLRHLLFNRTLLNSLDHSAALPAYFDLFSDVIIKSPIMGLAKEVLRNGRANVYMYTFDYHGSNTRFGYEFGNEHYPFNGGIHHSNDNIYLFSTHSLNPKDTEFAKKMVDLWTSFAIQGVPSTQTEPNSPPIPPLKDEFGPYFHINTQITIGDNMLEELTVRVDDAENSDIYRLNVPF